MADKTKLEENEILKDDDADKVLKSELETLTKDINVKESSSDKVDALFAKLDGVDAEAKNRALQYALREAKITVGNMEKSIAEIAEVFGKATEQDGASWKIKFKDGVSDVSEDEKQLVEGFLNEKGSSLAYLIQLSSKYASLQASKGYGRGNVDDVIDVGVDKIFGNQTRRALSGLKEWIQGDYTKDVESMDVKNLKVEDILNMKFISSTLKTKIETDAEDENVKLLWSNENYELKNKYTNNFALKEKGKEEGVDDNTTKERENKTGEVGTKSDEGMENNLLSDLGKKYGCRIEEKDENGNKVYKVKKGSEQFSFVYQKDERIFSFLSGGGSSFSIDIGNNKDEKKEYETALDKSVKIAAEIANIMTKAKNNTLDLEHFELSSDNRNLQADYKWRVFDFGSWTPIKVGKSNYSGVWDISLLDDIEGFLGIDPGTFCNFMNEYYENQKGKTAKTKGEVEITSEDGKNFEVESHGEKISFRKRGENTYVFRTNQGTELVINGNEEYTAHVAALINYIVSIVKNSGEKLEYFEADGDAIQADYNMRYFDVDLLSNVKKTVGVTATSFTVFMNSYRRDVGI